MQRLMRTTAHRKAAFVTTAMIAGGLGAVLLLPGTAMASTLPASASTPSQGPQPGGGSFAPQLEASNPPLTATAGSNYGYTFAASGHPSYSLSGAPGWLSINSATGQVSGNVPAGTNSFTYSVTASNSAGTVTGGPYTVQVASGQRQPGGPGNGQKPGGYWNQSDLTTQLNCPGSVKAGQSASCTLTVTNDGSGSARDVSASIDLPSALRAKYCGQATDWRWGWDGANCSISGNDASAQLGTVGAGQSKTVSVYFRASNGQSWSWGRSQGTVEVTGSARSDSGYNWGQAQSAQSSAYVTVYRRNG
jgi:hypothetical protein